MIERQALESQIKRIHQLVHFQRGLRLFLKFLWFLLLLYTVLMLAMIIMQQQWQRQLIWWGLLLIVLPPFLFFVTRREITAFVWRLDRRLGLKEQVSAAWQSLQKGDHSPFELLLFKDVLALLANVDQRVRKRGWYIQKDLLLVLIMGIVAFCVTLYSAINVENVSPSSLSIASLPPIQEEPTFEDVFPKGLLSFYEDGGLGEESGSDGSEAQQKAHRLKSALEETGAIFSKDIFTQSFGNALQNAQVEQAAQLLEMLANNSNLLNNDMKKRMSQYLEEAKKPFEKIGEQQIAQHLDETAKAIDEEIQNNTSGQDLKEKLQKLAKDLRDMAPILEKASPTAAREKSNMEGDGEQVLVSGAGSETSEVQVSLQQELAEPVERLYGEGTEVVFGDQEKGSEESQTLANPNAVPSKDNVKNVSVLSSLNVVRQGDEVIIQNDITPNYFSWTWKDEIAKYFEREH